MRNVSNDYLAQVQGTGRQFGVSVKVYGNGPEPESLWLGDIISIDILRSCSDQLQIGACMSDKLTLQTKATTLFNGRLKKIEVFYRCTAPVLDWAQLGTFYVDEAVTKQGVTAVTAYDMMSRLDKRVSWVDTSKATAPTFPCKMQAVLNYLCARAGVSTDFTCEDITIDKAPDGYTARELISYIAASHGRNARFSPSEVLKFPAYEEVGKTVQHGRCYSLDIAGGSGYTVKGILFQLGGDDKVYIDGTASEYDETADGIVTAFDPFATVGIAEYAWNRLGGLNYSAVSLEMPAENILEPGDVFTVEDADGSQKKAVVMEQELSLSCTGGFVERISCTAESKAQNRSTENRQDAAEKQIAVGSSGTALTEYKYISDNSVKFNGTTYTVEKDADTGLISKISDSSGNTFKPEISEGITDVAAHNAVFWAVAMCRGLSKQPFKNFMPEMIGVNWYYVGDMISNSSAWDNLIQGGEPIVLTNATATDGIVTLAAGGYGLLNTNHSGDITIYVIAANTSTASKWTQYAGMGNNSKSNGRELTVQSLGIEQGISCTTGLWGGSSSSIEGNVYPDTLITDIMDYHLVVLRRTKDLAEAFFDGVKSSKSKACYDFSSTFAMGGYYRGSSWDGLNSSMMKYKFIAIAACAQSDEQILKNSTWLINKYIGGNS